MKANELMIGDWIADKQGNRMRVVNILSEAIEDYYYGIETDKGFVDFEDAQPIPLTAEILEKNGFKCGIFPAWHINIIDDYRSLSAKYHEGSKTIFIAIKEPNFNLENACILYVHELQHVLKDCRIKKEIEL